MDKQTLDNFFKENRGNIKILVRDGRTFTLQRLLSVGEKELTFYDRQWALVALRLDDVEQLRKPEGARQ